MYFIDQEENHSLHIMNKQTHPNIVLATIFADPLDEDDKRFAERIVLLLNKTSSLTIDQIQNIKL